MKYKYTTITSTYGMGLYVSFIEADYLFLLAYQCIKAQLDFTWICPV